MGERNKQNVNIWAITWPENWWKSWDFILKKNLIFLEVKLEKYRRLILWLTKRLWYLLSFLWMKEKHGFLDWKRFNLWKRERIYWGSKQGEILESKEKWKLATLSAVLFSFSILVCSLFSPFLFSCLFYSRKKEGGKIGY